MYVIIQGEFRENIMYVIIQGEFRKEQSKPAVPTNGAKNPRTVTVLGLIGGGGRIRTIEAKRSRFTVCPLWPLGNSPIFCSFGCRLKECAGSGGAGRRTRTPDLLITNQLLYQLSYTGVSNRTRLL